MGQAAVRRLAAWWRRSALLSLRPWATCRCYNASVLVPKFGHETGCPRRRGQS
jgi:hypothetical protein